MVKFRLRGSRSTYLGFVKVYFAGALMDRVKNTPSTDKIIDFGSGGLLINVTRDYFQIRMPFYLSNNMKEGIGDYRTLELIGFSINIRGANPYRLIRDFVR